MDELIGYIFSSLRNSETAIKLINKALKSQAKLNGQLVTVAVVTTAYMCANEYERRKSNRKIEMLSKEIEELKKMKGE